MENIMEVTKKKMKNECSYEPAIPLLSIFPEKTKVLTWKDRCTPVIFAALFTVAKIKKLWYTQIQMEYYLVVKKNEILAFCHNMDGPQGH